LDFDDRRFGANPSMGALVSEDVFFGGFQAFGSEVDGTGTFDDDGGHCAWATFDDVDGNWAWAWASFDGVDDVDGNCAWTSFDDDGHWAS
jgi:hypothetical protein